MADMEVCERIVDKLLRLRESDKSCTAFGASYHRYRLGKTLSEADLASIERRLAITLPADYRAFLRYVGHGGAGPYYGLFTLEGGEDEDITSVEELRKPFRWTEPFRRTRLFPVPGALYICHFGCAIRLFLVVKGASLGELWIDRQAEEAGIEPVCDDGGRRISFLEWYEKWLDRELSKR